jgi:hypothetical protein
MAPLRMPVSQEVQHLRSHATRMQSLLQEDVVPGSSDSSSEPNDSATQGRGSPGLSRAFSGNSIVAAAAARAAAVAAMGADGSVGSGGGGAATLSGRSSRRGGGPGLGLLHTVPEPPDPELFDPKAPPGLSAKAAAKCEWQRWGCPSRGLGACCYRRCQRVLCCVFGPPGATRAFAVTTFVTVAVIRYLAQRRKQQERRRKQKAERRAHVRNPVLRRLFNVFDVEQRGALDYEQASRLHGVGFCRTSLLPPSHPHVGPERSTPHVPPPSHVRTNPCPSWSYSWPR